MKLLTALLLTLSTALYSTPVESQKEQTPDPYEDFLPSGAKETHKFEFVLEPIDLIDGFLHGNFSLKLSRKYTGGIAFNYGAEDSEITGFGTIKVTSYGIGYRGNYFLNEAYKNSVYFGHEVLYAKASSDFKATQTTNNTIKDLVEETISSISADGVLWKLSAGYSAYWSTFLAKLGIYAAGSFENSSSADVGAEVYLGITF